jgi:hypothetical protein
MKRTFPVWQITFPLGVVLIFALGAFTAIQLAHGRYTFEFDANLKQVRLRTGIEKGEYNPPDRQKGASAHSRHPSATI